MEIFYYFSLVFIIRVAAGVVTEKATARDVDCPT
jgi:hypothetical protein